MNLQERKDLLLELGNFMRSDDSDWLLAKQKATAENPWFITEFVDLAVLNITEHCLAEKQLQNLVDHFQPEDNSTPKKLGIVLEGNIPLAGFQDVICSFIAGHYALIKPSSKDEVLINFLLKKLKEFNKSSERYFTINDMLKGCDAYIATAPGNSAHYFEFYFSRRPHIVRRKKTSVAILSGKETNKELETLADDVYQYFGRSNSSVTKLFVPANYNFELLLKVFRKYNYLADNHKYKNNYDYHLAIHLLNKRLFMSNESLLLVEDAALFSPISQLHYEYYHDISHVANSLNKAENIQSVVGETGISLGTAQFYGCNFTEGVKTVEFLKSL